MEAQFIPGTTSLLCANHLSCTCKLQSVECCCCGLSQSVCPELEPSPSLQPGAHARTATPLKLQGPASRKAISGIVVLAPFYRQAEAVLKHNRGGVLRHGLTLLAASSCFLLQLPAQPLVCADHCGRLHDEGPLEGVGEAISAASLRQVWL